MISARLNSCDDRSCTADELELPWTQRLRKILGLLSCSAYNK